MKTIGLILIGLGLLMVAFTGFTLITKKKVVDLGKVEINREEKTPIYWSPITGGVIALGGVVVFALSKKK